LLRAMGRWGDAERFLERIGAIRAAAPQAALRSSFIVGYPGEAEEDHDRLLAFLAEARLDWAGFFPFSEEPGTPAARAPAHRRVPRELAMERLRECAELQDAITAERRAALVGERLEVLVDAPGLARSYREAPEIDGVVHVPRRLAPGSFHQVVASGSAACDLWAEPAP
jgi:ribosomal protein S12 methylthiotransferase